MRVEVVAATTSKEHRIASPYVRGCHQARAGESARPREEVVPVWCRFSRAFGSIPSHTVHGRRQLFRVFARGVVVLGRTLNQRVAGSIPARHINEITYL
jgi:hypothetical protein